MKKAFLRTFGCQMDAVLYDYLTICQNSYLNQRTDLSLLLARNVYLLMGIISILISFFTILS